MKWDKFESGFGIALNNIVFGEAIIENITFYLYVGPKLHNNMYGVVICIIRVIFKANVCGSNQKNSQLFHTNDSGIKYNLWDMIGIQKVLYSFQFSFGLFYENFRFAFEHTKLKLKGVIFTMIIFQ